MELHSGNGPQPLEQLASRFHSYFTGGESPWCTGDCSTAGAFEGATLEIRSADRTMSDRACSVITGFSGFDRNTLTMRLLGCVTPRAAAPTQSSIATLAERFDGAAVALIAADGADRTRT